MSTAGHRPPQSAKATSFVLLADSGFLVHLVEGLPTIFIQCQKQKGFLITKTPRVPSVPLGTRYTIWTVPATLTDSWRGIGPRPLCWLQLSLLWRGGLLLQLRHLWFTCTVTSDEQTRPIVLTILWDVRGTQRADDSGSLLIGRRATRCTLFASPRLRWPAIVSRSPTPRASPLARI